MKKKVAISAIWLLFVASILISYWLYINKRYVAFYLLITLYGVCILAVFGLIKYRAFMKTRLFDPRSNLKRKYAKIYLGILNSEKADDSTLDLRGLSRNAYVDSLLVQRYYSFLGPGGAIVIFTGKNKHYMNDSWICPLDYPLIHQVTLIENGINPPAYLMFNPFIGLLFLWMKVFGSKRNGHNTANSRMTSIVEFCKARNVNVECL